MRRPPLVERIARAIFEADHGHAPRGITLVTHTDNWSRLNREDRETADGYRHAARNVLRALSAAKLGPA